MDCVEHITERIQSVPIIEDGIVKRSLNTYSCVYCPRCGDRLTYEEELVMRIVEDILSSDDDEEDLDS